MIELEKQTYAPQTYRAWRVPRAEFEKRSSILKTMEDAEAKAQLIIDEANARGDQILREVAESVADVTRLVEDRVAQRLAAEIAETREKETSLASIELFALTRAIKEDYEAADSWLVDLVMGALNRVFDTMDEEQRAKGLIRSAVFETKSRWGLKLRVHPSQIQIIESLLVHHANVLKGVEAVVSDETLKVTDIILESAGGQTNISHHDQLDNLLTSLETTLSGDARC